MKDVLSNILVRSLDSVAKGEHPCLRLDQVSPVEDYASLRAPAGTAFILGIDGKRKDPLALIAITVPTLSTYHPDLLAMVIRRARAYKAPYFVTWTLRDAVLWKTPKPGVPAERSYLEKIRDYEDNYAIAQDAGKQFFDEQIKLQTIAIGQKILGDLERLFKDEALELVNIDATYFVQRLLDSVHDLLPLVTDSLHIRFATDPGLRAKFSDWALSQGIAGDFKDRDYALSIARHIIYRLLGKILFYQGLRRAARQLPPLVLDGIDSAQVLPTLRRAFMEALKVDYHAVFSEVDPPDTVTWPGEAAKRLAAMVHDFNTRNFSFLPQDVIGSVFERLIPPEERHLLGQYFTNETLCDLGIAFCVLHPNALVVDPTCGTGTFLIRAYDRKRWLGNHDHASLLTELWGIDIAPFPAELAVINLFRQNFTASGNFPRITCRDFFTIKPGDTLPFPPLKMDLERPIQIQEPVPLFDTIIGNFPYLRADQINQKDPGYFDFLRKTLIADWIEDYPQLFNFPSKKEQTDFEKLITAAFHKSVTRDRLQLTISTYADLYIYLFFHAARFLKPGGRMGIITSNAWLDVNFGYILQRFFCERFKIVAVLESRCEPWFTEASVNTVFSIVERCDSAEERDGNLVKFVKVKKRLSDLVPEDPQIQAVERWGRLTRLREKVERAGRKAAKNSPFGIVTEEDEDFRIRVCRQSELLADLNHENKTVKWGKYLRAPQVFLDVAENNSMCLLSQIAQVRRGSLTGINEFYHLTLDQAKALGIEPEFLKPLLKSPGESSFIPIDIKQLALRLFVCRQTKEELKKQGKTGALKYIEWGEKQVFQSGAQRGLTWPNGAEVKARTPGWYAIPEHRAKSAMVFFAQAINDRHFHRFSKTPLIADARLYSLTPKDTLSDELVAALLNSSICALSSEVFGRVMMGDGVLELKVEEANDYLLVPDIRGATAAHKKAIATIFNELCKREIGSVFDEVKRKDRQALDIAVLSTIGLDPKKYLKPIYSALCDLVRDRLSLGEQRGKLRKTKARKTNAEKEVFIQVVEEHLPNGPKQFPVDFYSFDASKGKHIEVALVDSPLRLDTSPFSMCLYAEKSVFRFIKNPFEGKFIIYCQQSGRDTANLPEKIVEISRTVTNYENYLRDLRKTLYEAFYRRTLDVAIAERLTQAAFNQFKLPKILSE